MSGVRCIIVYVYVYIYTCAYSYLFVWWSVYLPVCVPACLCICPPSATGVNGVVICRVWVFGASLAHRHRWRSLHALLRCCSIFNPAEQRTAHCCAKNEQTAWNTADVSKCCITFEEEQAGSTKVVLKQTGIPYSDAHGNDDMPHVVKEVSFE